MVIFKPKTFGFVIKHSVPKAAKLARVLGMALADCRCGNFSMEKIEAAAKASEEKPS